MKKRMLALLLALCLCLAMAACGSGTSIVPEASEAGSSEAAESAAESAAQPEVEAPEAEPEAETEVPASEEASEPETPEEAMAGIDSSDLYPVFDEMTEIEAFLNIAPWASAYIGPDAEFENAYAILYAQDITNVHLNCEWSDPDTYQQKMQLLIAANDLPHITRNFTGMYSTGEDGAIEDGLCVDLMEYFPEYAPEYYALLQSNANFRSQVVSTSGVATAMYSYTEIPAYTRGPMIRKDWLDELGLEIPTTVAELYDVAVAFKDKGVPSPVVSPKMIADAYYGGDFISSNSAAMVSYWNIDGVMTPAVTLDSNYDWVVEAKKWNEEKLFVEDWYNPLPFYDFDVWADKIGVAYGPYSMTSDATRQFANDPEHFTIYPMANVVLNEGDTIKTQDNSYGGRGDGDWCITTKDEDIIPNLVSYVNWFFTEEGIMVSNFGKEGETYTVDKDGSVHYTDMILKDPNGYGTMAVYAIFTNNNDNPFYFRMERTTETYDNEVEATVYDTWLSNMTSEYVATYSMTSEETEAFNAIATDLSTTLTEGLTKFMTGDRALSPEAWQSFQDELKALGLDDMTEIVQTAFDRSNAE